MSIVDKLKQNAKERERLYRIYGINDQDILKSIESHDAQLEELEHICNVCTVKEQRILKAESGEGKVKISAAIDSLLESAPSSGSNSPESSSPNGSKESTVLELSNDPRYVLVPTTKKKKSCPPPKKSKGLTLQDLHCFSYGSYVKIQPKVGNYLKPYCRPKIEDFLVKGERRKHELEKLRLINCSHSCQDDHKHTMGEESLAELAALPYCFQIQESVLCPNKRMYGADSIYEIKALPEYGNCQRYYTPGSLEDLRALPSLSIYWKEQMNSAGKENPDDLKTAKDSSEQDDI